MIVGSEFINYTKDNLGRMRFLIKNKLLLKNINNE